MGRSRWKADERPCSTSVVRVGDSRGWSLAALVVAGLSLTLSGCVEHPPDGLVTIDHALFVLDASDAIPDDGNAGWISRALPDRWDRARHEGATVGWYRVDVPLAQAPDEPWAIYLPAAVLNVAVYVNGELVGSGGRFTSPVARNWYRPLLFVVPARVLGAGRNTIHVRLKSEINAARLPILRVGPLRVLAPLYERRYFMTVTVTEITIAMTLGLALLLLGVYARRGEAGRAGWIPLGMALWALVAANGVVRDIPVPTRVWEWIQAVACNAFMPCFIVGFHRLLEWDRRRLEGLLAGWLVAVAVIFALVPAYLFFPIFLVSLVSLLALGVYLVRVILAADRDPRYPRTRTVAVPAVVGLVFVAHDVGGVALGAFPAGVLLTPLIVPLNILTVGWLLIGRLADGLNESERLNRELEQRVAEKHRELELNYARVGALERAQAVTAERERIMRDLHDGMGGQLVSALALAEGGQRTADALAGSLRDALDDLRLVIDSLEPVDEDLTAVLGNVRSRLEPRLARQGVRFDWQVADLPPLPGLGPARVLQVFRIVQEAITNVLRHAHARTIAVHTALDGSDGIVVEIRDDGVGFAPTSGNGHGVANMVRRAAALGGRLVIEPATPGTAVRLWLPLDGAPATRPA